MPRITVEIVGRESLLNLMARITPQVVARVRAAINETALAIQKRARELSPVGKSEPGWGKKRGGGFERGGRVGGTLRRSIVLGFPTADKGLAAEVYTGLSYAIYVHGGTRPHVIRAVHAKALAFQGRAFSVGVSGSLFQSRSGGLVKRQGPGTLVFRKQVNHPGTRPNPFLRTAAQEETQPFVARLREALGDGLKEAE